MNPYRHCHWANQFSLLSPYCHKVGVVWRCQEEALSVCNCPVLNMSLCVLVMLGEQVWYIASRKPGNPSGLFCMLSKHLNKELPLFLTDLCMGPGNVTVSLCNMLCWQHVLLTWWPRMPLFLSLAFYQHDTTATWVTMGHRPYGDQR